MRSRKKESRVMKESTSTVCCEVREEAHMEAVLPGDWRSSAKGDEVNK